MVFFSYLRLDPWKNFLDPRLLLQPLEYVYPLISQWPKPRKNITDKYFFRNRLNIMIIHRFVLNNSIHFIWENKKWKNLELHRKCTCISIMLQCMHLCIYNGYVQGVDQKYFWTWNKITHYSTIQRFNIHYTRLRILTSYTLGQSPWSMAMCLVWQSVLLGNGWNWSLFYYSWFGEGGGGWQYLGRQTP